MYDSSRKDGNGKYRGLMAAGRGGGLREPAAFYGRAVDTRVCKSSATTQEAPTKMQIVYLPENIETPASRSA